MFVCKDTPRLFAILVVVVSYCCKSRLAPGLWGCSLHTRQSFLSCVLRCVLTPNKRSVQINYCSRISRWQTIRLVGTSDVTGAAPRGLLL